MLTVQVADFTEAIQQLLARKTLAAVRSVAQELADDYRFELQRTEAPPHSGLGEIPHWYVGHKTVGYGPVFGEEERNNRPESGFATIQEAPLASYIEGEAEDVLGDIEGYVGFAPSHVVDREQNYLIHHDQQKRPWIDEIYKNNRGDIRDSAIQAFREAT